MRLGRPVRIDADKKTARRRFHQTETCLTILYRAVGFAGGGAVCEGGADKFSRDLLAFAFVGLVLVDMPFPR
jgi:hypothetical protein